ncbi:hypothetical protein HDA44_000481 [Kribbella solani]|uniref:Uncharacterized protein n=1 Tax=Kribbella solani TaxID=236067 RepID=A0A841DKD4_9ACTN|nr:hypothetical protein [Kribbella solani]
MAHSTTLTKHGTFRPALRLCRGWVMRGVVSLLLGFGGFGRG